MATQQSLDTVQSLYVAYYGRPADPAGLQYWAERLDTTNGNLGEIINAFGNSPEYTANLGSQATSDQVNSLYQQLFGRDAETEGLDFYTNMLNSGEKTLAEIALTISEAAQGSDRTTFEGRTAIANAFTQELDTQEEINAYSTARGVGIGRDYLQRVTEQTSAEEVLSEAGPVVNTLLTENEPETPPTQGGGGSPRPTLTITPDESGTITFSGTATGAITLTESDGVWTFTRGDTTATVTASDVKSIDLGNATLTTSAHLLNGIKVTGTGQLTLESLTHDVDLSGLDDSLTVNATIATDQDISTSSGLGSIDRYSVNSNATLTLSAKQANGLDIEGKSVDLAEGTPDTSKGGSVVVLLKGGEDQDAYDFTNITAGAASDDEQENGGTLVATLTESATLNNATQLGNFTLALDEESGKAVELTLTATQASGRTITGDANDTVTIDIDMGEADLGGIDPDIALSVKFSDTADISNIENLDNFDRFVVGNDATLTLSIQQADGQPVQAQGNGAVVVSGSLATIEGDDKDIDLTGLPVNFTFAGEPTEEPLIGDGITLRLTAAQADDRTIAAQGSGEVVVSGPAHVVAGGDIDLTGLPANLAFANDTLEVGSGTTLRLTAEQADGKEITGGGNVVIESLGSTPFDLSNITVTGTKTADVTDTENTVTLANDTDLGSFALDVQEDASITITSAQAANLTTLTGKGEAAIHGTEGMDTLNYVSKTGWDIDTLTIDGQGGNDSLYAPTKVDNVTLRGGEGADTYFVDNNRLTVLGDYDLTEDVLAISAGAIAAIDLSAPDVNVPLSNEVIDFSADAVASRLYNNGTLYLGGIGNGDSVAGTSGDDVYFIEEAGATLASYGANDIINLTSLGPREGIEVSAQGQDTVVKYSDSSDALLTLTGAQNTTITFVSQNTIFKPGDGANYDFVKVNVTEDIDESNATDDVHLLGGAADQTLTGGDGDDVLKGGGGANQLFGGDGDDKFYASSENTLYDGGFGRDRLVVFENGVDISNAEVISIETLELRNGDPLTVTISQAQLAAFRDVYGDSTIEKDDGDRIILNADGGDAGATTIMLAGSDGILHAIDNLHADDVLDFSELVGKTTFNSASDTHAADNVIGFVTGSNSASAADVDEAGEWAFNTESKLLTYFDGSDAQTITLTGITNLTAESASLTIVATEIA